MQGNHYNKEEIKSEIDHLPWKGNATRMKTLMLGKESGLWVSAHNDVHSLWGDRGIHTHKDFLHVMEWKS